jgi:tRNA 2-thiouridine synthesizing protein A
MSVIANRRLVDSRGSFCPGPITDLFKAYRAANVGDEIEIWATDPAARSDIEAWCQRSGNRVLEATQEKDYLRVVLKVMRKGR